MSLYKIGFSATRNETVFVNAGSAEEAFELAEQKICARDPLDFDNEDFRYETEELEFFQAQEV